MRFAGGKGDAGKQPVPIPMLGAGKLAHDVGIERSVFGRGEASLLLQSLPVGKTGVASGRGFFGRSSRAMPSLRRAERHEAGCFLQRKAPGAGEGQRPWTGGSRAIGSPPAGGNRPGAVSNRKQERHRKPKLSVDFPEVIFSLYIQGAKPQPIKNNPGMFRPQRKGSRNYFRNIKGFSRVAGGPHAPTM